MAAQSDVAALTERLGRAPQADFDVVVRDDAGAPVVVRNVPFTRDGTPMPTRYWLVDPDLRDAVSRIEPSGEGARQIARLLAEMSEPQSKENGKDKRTAPKEIPQMVVPFPNEVTNRLCVIVCVRRALADSDL